jgi:hypothetical protein
MIKGRCPLCSKRYEIENIDDQPGFPFCSERCKLIDLGRWIDGAYELPQKGTLEPQADDEAPSDPSED